ncbi:MULTISPECIES: CidA/LrgA family protein [unclassified Pseudoalteromonas]|jgi:holin-like protein|uniref:CidA/LrgA family protein n=1 Tax=unclassified Pseudoalteromonas TaxID=194690 RepID=UPI000C5FAEB3|nr:MULTISPECIES: CidA/LrgA family protein [unclassified Pseudoalteromonas]MBU76072.1 CidA/LrgA family protein [Pseudoalteromonadaceae bacterium]MCF2900325.1 CidA/LrgA family protein [Pseudoalteromonas sp. OFAV1]MCO7248633.1 CidA/LrgA family protein [Pseudoalteromonas sp. Ps84H-4]|tara:strand:+ start:56 stop:409 length:354 start_codon:yes stop_codon:yes gene_type:complete
MKYLISSAIILACLAIAKYLTALFASTFPAPLLGMVLLLILLLTGLVKEQDLKPSATPLLNFMPLFFIPAGVGIIEHLGVINEHWLLLLAVFIIVPLTSIILIGSLFAYFKGRENDS